MTQQSIVREVLESLIIKYQTRRWDSARTAVGVPSQLPDLGGASRRNRS